MMNRSSGILMPIFSLPNSYGIGNLGQCSRDFIKFLAKAKQTYWQILPIGPTGYGDSPYQSFSAFAGNPYFIDLEQLASEGYLDETDLEKAKILYNVSGVDYGALYEQFGAFLRKASDRLLANKTKKYKKFLAEQSFWLEEYALFMAIKVENGSVGLNEWPKELLQRDAKALKSAKKRLLAETEYYKAVQFFFATQWKAMKKYANKKGIKIIGDIPIYVSPDSSDLWASPELFQVDAKKRLTGVAGCPPDAFSADGQLWGNPLYNWAHHKKTNYAWWKKRMQHSTSIYDVVRIDHFRGFESYYAIPSDAKTAVNGTWEKGPGMALMQAIRTVIPENSVIAEDLGYITPEVAKLLKDSAFPGMKVLQFAFDAREPSNYLPHLYNTNSVVYTGTHDNTTTEGWIKDCDPVDFEYACDYIGANKANFTFEMIRSALMSVSNLAVIPMQDWLEIDETARINTPSTTGGNWLWRMDANATKKKLAKKIAKYTVLYGR